MAKKAAIKKKTFDIEALSDKFSSKTKYKKDRFIDLGEVFQKATGVPGPAIGHLNVFLGHSTNTPFVKSYIQMSITTRALGQGNQMREKNVIEAMLHFINI